MAGSSISRIFGTIRAVINFTSSELGLSMTNSFSGVYFDRSVGVEDRKPVTTDDIRTVQEECRKIDDDLRWLVALVSDTGMRLAEAAGLHVDDLQLGQDIPCVTVREHPWRRLKTAGSQRTIPLVGESLWAAQRLLKEREDSPTAVEARVVFYYGLKSLPHPWSLDRDELDGHFNFPVKEAVESCNEYFQHKLFRLIETVE